MRTYGRLREEIKKNFKTLAEFATAIGVNTTTLSAKLNGKAGWKQSEIENACRLLGISIEKVSEYFFYD